MGEHTVKLKNILYEGITLDNSNLKVYHYTKKNMGDEFTLDPQVAGKNISSYSKNDYSRSDVPRVFYYTDLTKVEKTVVSKFLYVGTVNGTRILDIQAAYTEYKSQPTGIAHDVMSQAVDEYGNIDFDVLLRTAKKSFDGVYYQTGGLPIVNLFIPLKVINKTLI